MQGRRESTTITGEGRVAESVFAVPYGRTCVLSEEESEIRAWSAGQQGSVDEWTAESAADDQALHMIKRRT